MKIALLAVLLIGCSGAKVFREPIEAAAEVPPDTLPAPEPRFIATDLSFRGTAHGPSTMILDDDELSKATAFRAVGVMEMEGKETKRLKAFYEAAALAGGNYGCDVLFQRDAFELGTRVAKPISPAATGIPIAGRDSTVTIGSFLVSHGREWQRTDRLVWQFICGMSGADDLDQAQSLHVATSKAVELRRTQLGNFEPCEPYTPLGSHIRKQDVCMDDPKIRREASSR
ncbi:MAG TPA: hypothetical protein VH083_26660 [Myxococcales bacterium]|nr:hypothetical protein [Myxococcales bacterium]